VRYEAAVETNLTFHTEHRAQRSPFPEPETVAIEFEGRRFVWNELSPNEEGEERWPVVTTMVDDPDDDAEERNTTASFLSALSFSTRQRIRVVMTGAWSASVMSCHTSAAHVTVLQSYAHSA